MSLALEIERRLQNLYISNYRLRRQLERQGEITCPTIYIKFRGNILFRVRRGKQLNPNIDLSEKTKSTTLYELFFDYESPFFYFFPTFNNFYFMPYPGPSMDKWNGLITFNTQEIKPKRIRGERLVYTDSFEQKKMYSTIWARYYGRLILDVPYRRDY